MPLAVRCVGHAAVTEEGEGGFAVGLSSSYLAGAVLDIGWNSCLAWRHSEERKNEMLFKSRISSDLWKSISISTYEKTNKKPKPDNASFSYATRLFLAKACARWEMFVPCRNPARLRSEMTWRARSLGSLCSGKKYNLSSRCVPESCLTGSLRGEYSEKQNICRKLQTRFLA